MNTNKRNSARLQRQPGHTWQLSVEDDLLITKNISDLSATGLSFKAPATAAFEPGQLLKFSISLQPGESFEVLGKILWVKSPEDRHGAMQQFGAHFVNLPARYDELITKEIFDSELKQRREEVKLGKSFSTHSEMKTPTSRSITIQILGYAFGSVLLGVIVTAAWTHHREHPEQSISEIFNQGMQKVMNNHPAQEPLVK